MTARNGGHFFYLTKQQIYDEAKKVGIAARSKMTKAQLMKQSPKVFSS